MRPTGPPVPDSEDLYRVILSPLHWAADQRRPSSAAFSDEVFSVEIASRTTPEHTAARKRDDPKFELRIVTFHCGDARSLGFDTRDERDEIAPENAAHAHVYAPSQNRKARARDLAKACRVVPFDASEAARLRAGRTGT
jgi:hypothetical protein